MSPLDLIYLAAASLRAGKGGKSSKAWCEAIDEAQMGYRIVLENAPGILGNIDRALNAAEKAVEPSKMPETEEILA